METHKPGEAIGLDAKQIADELEKFKLRLLLDYPFFGDILLRLPIIQDDGIPTACTDGRTIRWSAGFFGTLYPAQMRYVLMHEVLHTLLLHPLRTQGLDHEVWNIAADLVVNQMCDALASDFRRKQGLLLERPYSGVFSQVPLDESAENLYWKILEDNKGRRKRGTLLIRKQYRTPGGAGSEPLPVALPDSDLRGRHNGGLRLTPEEQKALEAQIGILIRTAAGDTRGDGVSTLVQRAVLQLTAAKPLDWRKILKDFLSEVQSDDTSYTTPERKYLHMGLILPGHGMQEGGDLESVWAFVDSSGSVSQDALEQFLTELYNITKEFGCVMNIAYWDTEVTDVYTKLRSAKQVLTAQPMHYGGTDINCVYRYIQERKLKPAVALILTDGYFGIPDPVLKKCLNPRNTILLLCNDSENPVYKTVGRVCRLTAKRSAK